MALGSVKIIKKLPSPQLQLRLIQDQIKRELVPVGQAHVDERKKIVADFDHKLEFGYRISAGPTQVTLTILLENENTEVSEGFTIGDLWKSLDKTGTRPHTIRAKKPGGRLAFQTGYQPHTRPIARSGGPGRASGPTVFRKQVQHPGFPPRKLSPAINKKLKPRFEKAIDRGVRLGSRKRR